MNERQTMNHEKCRRCEAATLTGCSNGGRLLSVSLTLEATPLLHPDEELAALHEGRTTWTVRHGIGGLDAWHRGSLQIRTRPAGHHPRQTVHAEHQCTREGR